MSISNSGASPQPEEAKPAPGAAGFPPVPEAPKPTQPQSPTTPPHGGVWQRALWAVLAFALGLLLVEAAVETLLGGAPVRWIVLGVAATSLVLAGLLYLRAGWAASAIAALLAFLALLALVAWLPGGSGRGVTLLRQPTPVVLAATCGFALLIAAGVFAATRILPLPARVVLALVAIYGAAAFIQGAIQIVPFAGLFHGQSLWTRLPWWLQGAFIGGFVILPLALLVQVVSALRKPRRFSRAAFAIGAWGMVIILAISGVKVQPGAAISTSAGVLSATSAAPPAPTAIPSSAERERLAARLDAIAAIARREAAAAPRDRVDPLAVLATTGKDPGAILAWVRSNTRLVPYRGMLRGARGVLMDRAGNSLDRTLLLADLLAKAGHEVRIARAELGAEAAATLRARVETSQPPSAPQPSLDRAALLARAGDPRIDPQLVDKAVDDTIAKRRRFDSTVRDLYGRVLPAVQTSLGDNQRRNAQLAADAETVLHDHFWVERQAATGWEALDPDGDVIQLPAPTATFSPAQVPAELRHEVALRLILETWSAGALTQTRLLERSWLPSETIDKPILLRHRLLPVPPIEQIVRERDPRATYRAALTGAWVVIPELSLGGEEAMDRLFTLRGDTLPANVDTLGKLGFGPPLSQGFSTLNQQLQGAFGGPQAGQTPATPPDENSSAVRVIAEWLEFEIHVPGRASERHRRTVFDLLRPPERARGKVATAPTIDTAAKERRALALASDIDVITFGATPADAWLSLIVGQGLSDAADQAAMGIRSGKSPLEALGSHPANRVPLPLWAWAVSRSVSDVLPPAAPVAPNVALFWSTPSPSGVVRVGFDIVANETSPAAGFNRRVAQGVRDTVLEHALFADGTPGGNAAALQALDLAAGRAWVLLDPVDRGATDRLNLPADAKARIQADLAAGSLVIAPREPTHTVSGEQVAWWRIDPRTGATLGISADGRGASQGEYGFLQYLYRFGASSVVCGFFTLGTLISKNYFAGIVGGALCVTGAHLAGWYGATFSAIAGNGVLDVLIGLITSVN